MSDSVKVVKWISLKLLHGFVKIDALISLSFYMNLAKLLRGFVKVVLYISRPLPNKTKLV